MLRLGRAQAIGAVCAVLLIATAGVFLLAGSESNPLPKGARTTIGAFASGKSQRVRRLVDPAAVAALQGMVFPIGSKIVVVANSWRQLAHSASIDAEVYQLGAGHERLRFFLLMSGATWQVEFTERLR